MHVDFRIPSARFLLPLLLTTSLADAFYIPGWSIKSYKNEESIPLFVNKVFSDNSQLQYAYYDLPFVSQLEGPSSSGAWLKPTGADDSEPRTGLPSVRSKSWRDSPGQRP
jgi:transmembrane 9 superfamily protein 2/4